MKYDYCYSSQGQANVQMHSKSGRFLVKCKQMYLLVIKLRVNAAGQHPKGVCKVRRLRQHAARTRPPCILVHRASYHGRDISQHDIEVRKEQIINLLIFIIFVQVTSIGRRLRLTGKIDSDFYTVRYVPGLGLTSVLLINNVLTS